jgi:adenine-specific DNA-methyltransferase
MRYFGSKSSTIKKVYQLVAKRMPSGSFCDPFGGIGIVGAFFKKKGYTIWCGDILTSAHYFQIARVERSRHPSFRKLRKAFNLVSSDDIIQHLNAEQGKFGWFVREYSDRRKFFTRPNALRINACRLRINKWWKDGLLSTSEYAVLLASLINSMDKVANTAGTYYAYLKKWYRKALLPFRFELIPPTSGSPECRSFLEEAKDLVSRSKFDVLYLDPPYNQRSYSRYYHLPETIARAEAPQVFGKAGIPSSDRPSSSFNKPMMAKRALEELLSNARFRLLVFHYSDDGLISSEDIRTMLNKYGQPNEYVLDSVGYTTKKTVRNIKHRLFVVRNG